MKSFWNARAAYELFLSLTADCCVHRKVYTFITKKRFEVNLIKNVQSILKTRVSRTPSTTST